MADAKADRFAISDLYRAYRKAKSNSYFDKGHFNSFAFIEYERKLQLNLERLASRLNEQQCTWQTDIKFIGGYSYLPKSVAQPEQSEKRAIHFATLDPLKDWESLCGQAPGAVESSFRQIITPTVNYQIVSALWLMKAGHEFDAGLDRKLAYAHKLRRVGGAGELAADAHALFVPYMTGYGAWRARGLHAMRAALEGRKSIVAVTMDVQKFYHRVSPKFLLNRSFRSRVGINLTPEQISFTEEFVQSLDTWYESTPDFKNWKNGALPVGLSASRVISNVLLSEFDRIVSKLLKVIYYGRYADDIFLVVEQPSAIHNGEQFVRWLRKTLDGWLVLDQEEKGSGLRLKLPYARDSEIVFASAKQKIFFLSGEHGFDLVDQIVEKIKEQSSEYRQLPVLPVEESKMVAQALLATSDARLEADAIRKAEGVSLRRLGFSLLLGDVEQYARDLNPNDWSGIRHKFYGLVNRYVLTAQGYFDYSSYIVRAFGLIVACGDIKAANVFLDKFHKVFRVLLKTTTAGGAQRLAANASREQYIRGFVQVAFEAASVKNFRFTVGYTRLINKLRSRHARLTGRQIRSYAKTFLKSDLGRRPYYVYWFDENKVEKRQPLLPQDFSVRRVLALTKQFRGKIHGGLNSPYWPAIAFPTRPIPLWNLTVAAPKLLFEQGGLAKAIWATRGSKTNPSYPNFAFVRNDGQDGRVIEVPSSADPSRMIGVPSYLTTLTQFEAAIAGDPDRSLDRYVRIRRLINKIMRDSPGIKYIAFPECSIPIDWALGIAKKLGERGISFISGIENRGIGNIYTNEALVALSSDYFGRRGTICFVQPKLALAHDEAVHCAGKVFVEPSLDIGRPLYVHGGLCFGVLICSDLTTISNRSYFQGKVDALFVLEWNKDVGTFEFLVESTAHDLHAPVVQINNREYGDSRIRVPFRKSFLRDVVRVKGGDEDFYVVSTLNFSKLREFQRHPIANGDYKPLPIGYVMSDYRRNSSDF